MTDSSGFGSSLNLIRNLVQTKQEATRQKLDAAIQRISQELTQELQNAVRPVKVRGEVTQATPNPNTGQTSVVVQTPQGEVEITLPPEQTPPPRTVLEIEIPPRPQAQSSGQPTTDQPQQQVRVQLINSPQASTQTQPPQTGVENLAQPPIQTEAQNETQTTVPRQTNTPVDVRIQQTVDGTIRPEVLQTPRVPTPVVTGEQQPLPTTLPAADTVIRLLPVSPAQVANLLVSQEQIPQQAQQILQQQVQLLTPLNVSAVTLPLQGNNAQQSLIPALQSSITAVNETLQTTSALNAALQPNTATPLQSFFTALTPNISEALQTAQSFVATRLAAPVQQFFGSQVERASTQVLLNTPPITSALPAITTALTEPLQSPLTTSPLEVTKTISSNPKPIDVKILSVEGPRIELSIPGTNTIQNLQNVVTAKPNTQAIVTNNSPATLTGTIVGTTPESLPIVNVFLGTDISVPYIIQTPVQSITPGTTVTLTPQTTQSAAPIAEQAASFAPLLPSLMVTPGTSWPVMDEILQTLTQTSAPTAQAFSNVVPNAANPAQITPAAMFFIAAIRGGDIQSWLGDKASDALRSASKGGLLSRLTQEGGLLNRLSSEAPTQDWRSLALPMNHQNEIQKIAIHYRHEDHGEDNAPDKSKTTRFIFDLSLSNMGQIQVDGLFRGHRLDVVVRSDEFFSQAMQADMKRKYGAALGYSEFEGELTFQGQLDGWVTINIENEQTLGLSA